MPGFERGYNVVDGIWKAVEGVQTAAQNRGPETIAPLLNSASGAMSAAGWMLGGTLAPAGTPLWGAAGASPAFTGLGTSLMSFGALTGAGALGFGIGTLADRELGISDKIVGTIDDDLWRDQGLIATTERGPEATERAGMLRAARLAQDEARRQQEIAELAQRAEGGGLDAAFAATQLRVKHGISHGVPQESPAVEHIRRETARQVQLSNAIRARELPFTGGPMADIHLQWLLAHGAE